ncbi:MAG: hypothetical protein K2X91_12120, partial [Thermoleophilia bacterium]|nr:hypothetical protein [Thermoleophilia bacterium]
MSLGVLRRPQVPGDRPTAGERDVLAAALPDCRLADARLAAEDGGVRYWILPTWDGQAVWFVGLSADRRGGGGGGLTTFDHLAATGGAITTSIHRGRRRYAVLVADGVERVRAGPVERGVDDN